MTTIMNNTGFHISSIDSRLKGLKSTLRAEFIRPTAKGIIIATNNVPASSDLTTMEKYIQSIEGIEQSNIFALRLPQLKTYLKIIGILYIQPSGMAITSDDITNYLKNSDFFEDTTLAARPRVIKASPKSDMAIIWINIWDSQNSFKAKILINHSFHYSRSIATIRGTSMNPGIPQCHNYWK